MEKDDDGHMAKLARSLAHGEQVCKPYEDRDSFRIKGKMWPQLGHMGKHERLSPFDRQSLIARVAIDSVEDTGAEWVRSAGFDEAWKDYEDRPRAQL